MKEPTFLIGFDKFFEVAGKSDARRLPAWECSRSNRQEAHDFSRGRNAVIYLYL